MHLKVHFYRYDPDSFLLLLTLTSILWDPIFVTVSCRGGVRWYYGIEMKLSFRWVCVCSSVSSIQWFTTLHAHQNHLENFLKPSLPGIPLKFQFIGPGNNGPKV